MIKVLLDTNFLMIPYVYKIDIFQEIERLIPESHEIFIPSNVLEELQELSNSKGKEKIAARVAIQLVEKKSVKKIQSQSGVDEFMINFAVENKPNVVVCTNDRELKKRLKEVHIPVIVMRGRNRLEFY